MCLFSILLISTYFLLSPFCLTQELCIHMEHKLESLPPTLAPAECSLSTQWYPRSSNSGGFCLGIQHKEAFYRPEGISFRAIMYSIIMLIKHYHPCRSKKTWGVHISNALSCKVPTVGEVLTWQGTVGWQGVYMDQVVVSHRETVQCWTQLRLEIGSWSIYTENIMNSTLHHIQCQGRHPDNHCSRNFEDVVGPLQAMGIKKVFVMQAGIFWNCNWTEYLFSRIFEFL